MANPTPEEVEAARKAAEEAARRAYEETNKQALPDQIPARKDIK